MCNIDSVDISLYLQKNIHQVYIAHGMVSANAFYNKCLK